MNNLKIKTLKCICNARKAIYDKEYEKADKLLAESIEVLRELWGEKDDSGWKYVSDGELPEKENFKVVGTKDLCIPFAARYLTINEIWLDVHGRPVMHEIYCWRELPQLPPVR